MGRPAVRHHLIWTRCAKRIVSRPEVDYVHCRSQQQVFWCIFHAGRRPRPRGALYSGQLLRSPEPALFVAAALIYQASPVSLRARRRNPGGV